MSKIDIKILELIEVLKSHNLIRFEQDFCDEIGLLKQNIYRIKKGLAHFTPEHIKSICVVYNVNANWIFGIENQIFTRIKSDQKSNQTLNIQQT